MRNHAIPGRAESFTPPSITPRAPRLRANPRKQGVLARSSNGSATRSHPSAGLVVVVDSREQTPWTFTVPTVVAGLPVGDYSVAGHETELAIERKTLSDFISSVTWERPRFWRELEKLAAYRHGAVIVEASVSDVLAGRFVSKARPWAILTSALAISTDFGIQVLFAGNAPTAARCAEWMLKRWHEKHAPAHDFAAPLLPGMSLTGSSGGGAETDRVRGVGNDSCPVTTSLPSRASLSSLCDEPCGCKLPPAGSLDGPEKTSLHPGGPLLTVVSVRQGAAETRRRKPIGVESSPIGRGSTCRRA